MNLKLLIIVTLVTLPAFLNTSFGQAPSLGTASSFALFTVVGAVTNVGSSTITGDIGTNAGDISGFETAILTGSTRIALSSQSIQAALDVVSAYNSLSAILCGTTIIAELASQTLTTGVYCQTATDPTSLNGTLTLSGPGVFIIKLNSALTTATNSAIVLTNGASASNVYFQIMGAATLGTGSTFKGTIIAMGAIVLNTTILDGRALSVVGAITVNESKVSTLAAISDLSPIIYALPSQIHGTNNNFTVVVDVVELKGVNSSGPVKVRVTKDALVSLAFPPSSFTSVGGRTVQNSVWTLDADSDEDVYIFTTSSPIPGSGKLSFGLVGSMTPGASTGTLTVSVAIVGGSGNEVKTTNNLDADKVDYFQ